MIILLVAVAAVTSGVLSKFVLPKVYQATAMLMVTVSDQNNQTVVSQNSLDQLLNNVSSLPQNSVETYVGELTSDSLLNQVAKELPPGSDGKPYDYLRLGKMISVNAIQGSDQKDTNLIQINVSDTSPTRAALIANTLSQAFLNYLSNQNSDLMARSVTFLETQAGSVGAQRAAFEKKLVALRSGSNPLSLLQAEIQSQTTDLGNLNTQIEAAQVTVAADQAAQQSLAGQVGGLSPTTTLQADPGGKGQPTSVENPVYTSTQEASIQAAAKLAQDKAQLQELQTQAGDLEKTLEDLHKQEVTQETTQDDLQNQLTLLNTAYQTLSQKVTDSQVAEAARLGETSVAVASSALAPNVPVKPNTKMNVALAIVLALMVAIFMAFLLEYLDATVKTPEDIEQLVQLPTLGSIPAVGAGGGRA